MREIGRKWKAGKWIQDSLAQAACPLRQPPVLHILLLPPQCMPVQTLPHTYVPHNHIPLTHYITLLLSLTHTHTHTHTHTQVILQHQDEQLDRVGASVSTLKRMGETIGEELDDQQMWVEITVTWPLWSLWYSNQPLYSTNLYWTPSCKLHGFEVMLPSVSTPDRLPVLVSCHQSWWQTLGSEATNALWTQVYSLSVMVHKRW